jgi:hypothetical protein
MAKLGYATNKQKSGLAWLKGVLLQWLQVFAHVDIMLALARQLLPLCGDVTPRYANEIRSKLRSGRATGNLATTLFLRIHYNLTTEDMDSWFTYVKTITLTSIIDHPLVEKLCRADELL